MEASLKREKLLLVRSIANTRKRLRDFEESKGMSSKEFFEKFEKTLDEGDRDVIKVNRMVRDVLGMDVGDMVRLEKVSLLV